MEWHFVRHSGGGGEETERNEDWEGIAAKRQEKLMSGAAAPPEWFPTMPPRRGLRVWFGFGFYNDGAPTALRRLRILTQFVNSTLAQWQRPYMLCEGISA